MSTVNKEFGNRIRLFRTKLRMTQSELAKAMNTTQSAIAKYENGKRRVSLSFVQDLAKCFNISEDELIGIEKTTSTQEEIPQGLSDLVDVVKQSKLTEDEIKELLNYTKFLISKRE